MTKCRQLFIISAIMRENTRFIFLILNNLSGVFVWRFSVKMIDRTLLYKQINYFVIQIRVFLKNGCILFNKNNFIQGRYRQNTFILLFPCTVKKTCNFYWKKNTENICFKEKQLFSAKKSGFRSFYKNNLYFFQKKKLIKLCIFSIN